MKERFEAGVLIKTCRESSNMSNCPVKLELPGGITGEFTDLVLDYTGTLSKDGVLLSGVAERLAGLSGKLRITILTADTFGKAAEQVKNLPLDFQIIRTGSDKVEIVEKMGGENVIAVGNGRNDLAMMDKAGLGIAVIGPEGAAAELFQVVDVVVNDIRDGLDLILHPLRLKATLRD